MTREELDVATFQGTVSAGSSESLQIDTSRADDVLVLIDNGATDGEPAEYTLTQRIYNNVISDWQLSDQLEAQTSRSWVGSAWGDDCEFEFTNTSGATGTYRIVVKSYRDIS